MNNFLKYKEYLATINFSPEDEVFYGNIFGIDDVVTFEGTSVQEVKNSFYEAVDDYLSTCKELQKVPEKSYKGSFNVRVPVTLHKEAAFVAAQKSITLNEFVKAAISYAVKHEENIDFA